jgi:dethiobiotin synthetase
MQRRPFPTSIFVTGTDTGVGKTLLTALLLHHLRKAGCHALAMKPFCSGGRADVALLQSLQAGELTDEEANPFIFPEPVSPLISLRRRRRNISLGEVIKRIRQVASKCDCLLVEGSGGLFVPLSKGYMVADLIARLNGYVVVVARNRLGTINHTLLTVKALRERNLRRFSVVLMDGEKADFSSATNAELLAELLKIPVLNLPFLGGNCLTTSSLKRSQKKVKKILARISNYAILNSLSNKQAG